MRCSCQNRELPAGEFEWTTDHGWVHKVVPPQTTDGGPIHGDPFPGTGGGGPTGAIGDGLGFGGGSFPVPAEAPLDH